MTMIGEGIFLKIEREFNGNERSYVDTSIWIGHVRLKPGVDLISGDVIGLWDFRDRRDSYVVSRRNPVMVNEKSQLSTSIKAANHDLAEKEKIIASLMAVAIGYGICALARWTASINPLENDDAWTKRARLLEVDR